MVLKGSPNLYPNGIVWVDVSVFEEATANARRTNTPAAYEMALKLCAGELLPRDLYEEWAENRRAELRGTRLRLLVELPDCTKSSGDRIRPLRGWSKRCPGTRPTKPRTKL